MIESNRVSIIIPIYNTETYLDDCVASVIDQSYTNLEIILVDDGSQDRSFEICKRWAEKDKRIKVFHQENKGVSAARNLGLCNVTGNYVTFVDSDDTLKKNAIEVMISGAHKTHADFYYTGISKEKGLKSGESFFHYLLRKRKFAVWGALFCADKVKNICFDEGLSNNEDAVFLFRLAKYTNAISGIDTVVYNHSTDNAESLSSTTSIKKLNSTLKSCDIIEEILKGDFQKEFLVYKFYMYCYVLLNISFSDEKECLIKDISSIKKFVKSNYFSWLRLGNNKTSKEIIEFFGLSFMPNAVIYLKKNIH